MGEKASSLGYIDVRLLSVISKESIETYKLCFHGGLLYIHAKINMH